jgi:hypothetical protein
MSHTQFVAGIDPGRSGAVVVIDVKTGRPVRVYTFDAVGVYTALHNFSVSFDLSEVPIYIEKVHSSPQMGVVSAFSFGKNFGEILGYVHACEGLLTQVPPQTWQKVVTGEGETPKERAMDWARREGVLFRLTTPAGKKPHEGAIDAYGIARYGREVILGAFEAPVEAPKKKRPKAVTF